MARPSQVRLNGMVVVAIGMLVAGQVCLLSLSGMAVAQTIAPALPSPSRSPASDRRSIDRSIDNEAPAHSTATTASHYVGLTKCAACHYKYYEDWKASPHGQAFEILPAKYRSNGECLKCHATGHHAATNVPAPTGVPATTSTAANVTGVTCEACHGPGSEHANLALSFVGQENLLNDESLKSPRARIRKTALDQCIQCHTAMAHQPHPEFDRGEDRRRTGQKLSPGLMNRLVDFHQRP